VTDFDVATLSISADSGRKVVHKRRVYSGSPWNVDKCWVVVCYKFGPHSWATARRVCNLYSAFRRLPVNFQSRNHAHKVLLRGANRTAPINHRWYMFHASNCLFVALDSHFWPERMWCNSDMLLTALVFHQTSLPLRYFNEKFIWKHSNGAHVPYNHVQCWNRHMRAWLAGDFDPLVLTGTLSTDPHSRALHASLQTLCFSATRFAVSVWAQ